MSSTSIHGFRLSAAVACTLLCASALFAVPGPAGEIITENNHSKGLEPAQIEADLQECVEHGIAERRRLLEELMLGLSSTSGDDESESSAGQMDLINYLGGTEIPGSGYTAMRRLQYTCLRARGYRVEDYETDGAGKVQLKWSTTGEVPELVLNDKDGTERAFFLTAILKVETITDSHPTSGAEAMTYEFPRVVGNSDAAVRINTYLHAVELESLPGEYEASPFERIWPGLEPPYQGVTWMRFDTVANEPGFITLGIYHTYLAAYPSENART